MPAMSFFGRQWKLARYMWEYLGFHHGVAASPMVYATQSDDSFLSIHVCSDALGIPAIFAAVSGIVVPKHAMFHWSACVQSR